MYWPGHYPVCCEKRARIYIYNGEWWCVGGWGVAVIYQVVEKSRGVTLRLEGRAGSIQAMASGNPLGREISGKKNPRMTRAWYMRNRLKAAVADQCGSGTWTGRWETAGPFCEFLLLPLYPFRLDVNKRFVSYPLTFFFFLVFSSGQNEYKTEYFGKKKKKKKPNQETVFK